MARSDERSVTTPSYDTKDGIQASLGSLEAFHELLRQRHEAGYDRNERLEDFCVLGRYVLDALGNFGVILASSAVPIPRDYCPKIDDVLTYDELANLQRQIVGSSRIEWSLTASIAVPDAKCAVCERGWTLSDAHDCLRSSSYSVDDEEPNFIYRHGICNKNLVAAQRRATFELMFDLAGYSLRSLRWEKIPNGYSSEIETYNGPWFNVTTPHGMICIGWRKRVIQINWEATGRDLSSCFSDVGDTKGPDFVHAWTMERVVNYLGRIRLALAESPQPVPTS